MSYLKYLRYLMRHKWFVALECFKRGLIWRGLVHDWSKFLPDEYLPYARYFYGRKDSDIKRGRNSTGYYKPTDTGDAAFDFAWLLHQKRNRHHWQWWILPEDEGGVKILSIQNKYLIEMVCDWLGAGRAQAFVSPADNPFRECRNWYRRNKDKMQLHPHTRATVEMLIDIDRRDK